MRLETTGEVKTPTRKYGGWGTQGKPSDEAGPHVVGSFENRDVGVRAFPWREEMLRVAEEKQYAPPRHGDAAPVSRRSTTSASVRWLSTPTLLPSGENRKSAIVSVLKLVIRRPGEPSNGWSHRLPMPF